MGEVDGRASHLPNLLGQGGDLRAVAFVDWGYLQRDQVASVWTFVV